MVFVELQHLGAYLLETERHGNVLAYLEIAHVFLLPPAPIKTCKAWLLTGGGLKKDGYHDNILAIQISDDIYATL